tara:strand:- start:12870 stop:13316 length:447 start_codon:yes stop_codon:yes gene_type:complete
MNKLLIAFCLVLSAGCFAQENQKKIAIESWQEGDSAHVIIRTTDNGIVTEEVYTGKEALRKMEEFNEEMGELGNEELQKEVTGKSASKSIEVQFREIQGVKTLELKETINGKLTTYIYQGEEAEKKLKELQNTPSNSSLKRVKKQKHH